MYSKDENYEVVDFVEQFNFDAQIQIQHSKNYVKCRDNVDFFQDIPAAADIQGAWCVTD